MVADESQDPADGGFIGVGSEHDALDPATTSPLLHHEGFDAIFSFLDSPAVVVICKAQVAFRVEDESARRSGQLGFEERVEGSEGNAVVAAFDEQRDAGGEEGFHPGEAGAVVA